MMLDTGFTGTMLTDSGVQKWGIAQSGRTYGIAVGEPVVLCVPMLI